MATQRIASASTRAAVTQSPKLSKNVLNNVSNRLVPVVSTTEAKRWKSTPAIGIDSSVVSSKGKSLTLKQSYELHVHSCVQISTAR